MQYPDIQTSPVLLVPHFNHSFDDMLPVALRLREQAGLEPVFLMKWADCLPSIAKCQVNGIPYVLQGNASKTASAVESNSVPNSSYRIANRGISRSMASSLNELRMEMRNHREAKQDASEIIDRMRPSCIVIYDDRAAYLYKFLIQAANAAGISTVLFPNESVDPVEIFAEDRYLREHTVESLSPLQKLVYAYMHRRTPRLSMTWQGKEVLWVSPVKALVSHWNGIFPKQPWVRGGGDINWIALASHGQHEALERAGVDSTKLLLTGFPPHDATAVAVEESSRYRWQLCQRYGIPENAQVACFADQVIEEFEWYASLDIFIEDTLFAIRALLAASPNVHIVYKLHPRNQRVDLFSEFYDEPRFTLVRDADIRDIVIGSDFYVTSYSSSVYGAIAADKPVIAYDFQGMRIYDLMVGHVEGIYSARSRQQFSEMVAQVIESLEESTSPYRRDWYAMTDGGATERMTSVIRYLAGNPDGDPHQVLNEIETEQKSALPITA